MNAKRFTLLVLLVASVLNMWADVTFTLLPPRTVVQGRNFQICFRLIDGEANAPSAPQLDGCTLLYGPAVSTSQSTQIINGHISSTSSVDYYFTYRADRPGTVRVPAVSISVGGKSLSTSAASFKILPSDEPPVNPQSSANRQPDQQAPQEAGAKVSANDLFVRIFFSKNSVYEQEPVVATIKVYTVMDISSFVPTAQPAFEGFLAEELPVEPESNIEHYNGRNYHTAVLKRLLLYPQKAGQLKVNSGKYDVTVVQYETVSMGFFRTQRPVERKITTSSNAASLSVKALPEPRPEGFNGAVGVYSVSTKLNPEILRTNEAAVYSYIVSGKGNVKFLSSPDLKFPSSIDAYTPKTDIKASVVGGGTNMSGTFQTDFTFVPQETGEYTIPGVPFVYFNPESGKYVTIDVPPTDIKVLKGTAAAPSVQQKEIEKTMNDILHIRPSESETPRHALTATFFSLSYWLAYAAAIVALVSVVFAYRRHIRLSADVTGRKLAKASKVANRRLRLAREAMQKHQNDAFYTTLSQALKGYLSDKLAIPASQLTSDNISERLAAAGVSEADINSVLAALDECEMARFTPSHSDDEVSRLYKDAQTAINNIENAKKRP